MPIHVAYINGFSNLYRMPIIRQLLFFCVESGVKNLNSFLLHVAPKQIQEFYFGGSKYGSGSYSATEITDYIEGLASVCKASKSRIGFHNCAFSDSEFVEIVKSSMNVPILVFEYCKFSLESDISFADLDYKIEIISFQDWGDVIYSFTFNKNLNFC